MGDKKIMALKAKPGLDGHDRCAKALVGIKRCWDGNKLFGIEQDYWINK
jgi:hypothetical protein